MQVTTKKAMNNDPQECWGKLLAYLGLTSEAQCDLPGLMMKMQADVVTEGVMLGGVWAVSGTRVEAIVSKFEPDRQRIHISLLDADGIAERIYKYSFMEKSGDNFIKLTVGQHEHFGLIGWSLSLLGPFVLPLKFLTLGTIARQSIPRDL